MKRLLFVLIALYALQLNAQDICGQNRYLEEVFTSIDFTSGIEFANADPYGLINNQTLRLDIYEPEGDTLAERPLLIHAFGGGFLIGFRSEPDIPNWGTQYAKRGFVFVSIDYRLGFNAVDPGSPIRAAYRATQDLRAALRFLKDNAATYRLDMDNVFLTGSSAGCFAALIQSFMNESDRPAATYGTFLEPQDLGCVNCSGNNNNNNEEVPVHGIVNNWGAILDTAFINLDTDLADNIPVISFHGTNDLIVPYGSGFPFNVPIFPLVDGSAPIHHRLDQQGIYNQLYPLQGLGHEPELLNPWVTDTIVENASIFLYEIMRPKTDSIQGAETVCIGRQEDYSVAFNIGSQYCWEVSGGTIVNQQQNTITVEWQALRQGNVSVTEYNAIHAKTTQSLNVAIGTEPIAGFQYSSNDGLFDFHAADTAALAYNWDFGDGQISQLQNPQNQFMDTGKFVVQLITENLYCASDSKDTITSDICPVAGFTAMASDSTVLFDANLLFGSNAQWDFGNGQTYSGFDPQPAFDTNGNYSIQLILSNDFCSDTLVQQVEIEHCPIADFEIGKNALAIELENFSYNNFLNYWSFENGLNSRMENPSIVFDSSGIYEIELIVFNRKNCSDTLRKLIYVESENSNPNDSIVNSLDNFNSNYGLEIYPNPIKDQLFIKDNGMQGKDAELKIWNMSGQLILTENSLPRQVDFSEYSRGIYLLQIRIDEVLISKKVLKN